MTFIQKNKVIIVAFLGAIILAAKTMLAAGETDFKVIGFAVLIAALGVAANSWKGQGVTILGILGTISYVFVDTWNSEAFTWAAFASNAVIAILTAVMSQLSPEPEQV